MLALDVIFGSPLVPDLLGILAGHLYYFLTVLHPLAGGKNILRTPFWVYPSSFGFLMTDFPWFLNLRLSLYGFYAPLFCLILVYFSVLKKKMYDECQSPSPPTKERSQLHSGI